MWAALAALLGLVGVAATAIVTWRLGTRKSSGLIDTTEASSLWDAAEEIRKELRSDVAGLRERLSEQAIEMLELRKRVRAAEIAEQECETRVRTLSTELGQALERIRILERDSHAE